MAHRRITRTVALLVVLLLLGHALTVAACATSSTPDGAHGQTHLLVAPASPMPDADLLIRSVPGHLHDWLECDTIRVLDRSRASALGGQGAASSLAAAIAPLRTAPRIVAAERGAPRSDPPDASTTRALLQVFLN